MQKIHAKKQALSKHSQALNHIESLFQNEDYQGIADGYGNQGSGGGLPAQSSSKVISQTIHSQNSSKNNSPNWFDQMLKNNMDFGAHVGEKYGNVFNVPESSKLFLHSTHINYPIGNALNSLYYGSINNIHDPSIRAWVESKIKAQLGNSDCPGVILFSKHPLADKIAHSQDIKEFILTNKTKLINGQFINGSKTFKSKQDLRNSINSADIINAHLDKAGNFNAIVIDVYNFANEGNILVKTAYNLQEKGLLKNYFIVIYIKLDKYQVARILNNK